MTKNYRNALLAAALAGLLLSGCGRVDSPNELQLAPTEPDKIVIDPSGNENGGGHHGNQNSVFCSEPLSQPDGNGFRSAALRHHRPEKRTGNNHKHVGGHKPGKPACLRVTSPRQRYRNP